MTEYQASNIAVEDTENSTLFKHTGIHYNFVGKKIRKRRHGFLATLQESRIKKWQQ
jgi:hypothetical protein